MKKNSLIIILLVGFATQAYCQFEAGASGGFNLSTLGGADVEDNKTALKLNIGMWGKYNLAENFDGHMGLLITGLGAKFPGDSKLNLTYLQVPVYGGYKLHQDENLSFSALVGGYLGFLASSKYEIDGTEFDLEPNSLDFGLSLGFDVGIQENMFIRTTYNYGLLKPIPDFNSPGIGLGLDGFKAYNRYLQISFVYYFYKM